MLPVLLLMCESEFLRDQKEQVTLSDCLLLIIERKEGKGGRRMGGKMNGEADLCLQLILRRRAANSAAKLTGASYLTSMGVTLTDIPPSRS